MSWREMLWREMLWSVADILLEKHPLVLSRIESEMVIMWPLLDSSYILPEWVQITGSGDWFIKEEVVSKEGVLCTRWSWNWSDTIYISEEKITQHWALRNPREHGWGPETVPSTTTLWFLEVRYKATRCSLTLDLWNVLFRVLQLLHEFGLEWWLRVHPISQDMVSEIVIL